MIASSGCAATLSYTNGTKQTNSMTRCDVSDWASSGHGVAGRSATRGTCRWPRPGDEVKFTEWTEAGEMRHPVFLGLRTDKKATDVIRELPKHIERPK